MTSIKTLSETNADWNRGGFNHSALIGSVMALAKEFMPSSAEDFENQYYCSGEERERLLNEMSEKKKSLCNDIDFLRKTEGKNLPFTHEEKELLYYKGRTRNFINKLVDEFATYAGISKKRAYEHVRTRIFKETFMGHMEEINARDTLNEKFSNFNVILAPSAHDSAFAIDLEILYQDKIIAGVQVKPRSYAQYKNDVTSDTSKLNKEKNEKFKNKYKVPVLWYYYDTKGKYTIRDFDDKSKFLLNNILRDVH